ncbi:MAG: hypothetical protein JWQ97_2821, partial [Phenylobacterium sp.]|nr:hypothetical protein [Phenylobacterium sp.]
MTHFLQRTALIALATGALGACSTTESDGAFTPNFPVRAPDASPAPSPAAPASESAPAARPSETPVTVAPAAPVGQRPLEP